MVSLRINLVPRLSFEKKSKGKSEDSTSQCFSISQEFRTDKIGNRKSKGRSHIPSSPSPRSPYFTRTPPSSPRRLRPSTASALRVTLGPTILRSNITRRSGSAGNGLMKRDTVVISEEIENTSYGIEGENELKGGKGGKDGGTPFTIPESTMRKPPRPLSSLKSISLRVAVPHRSTLSPKSTYMAEPPRSAFLLDYVKSPLSYAFASHGNSPLLVGLEDKSSYKGYGSRVGGSMSARRTSMVDMMNKMDLGGEDQRENPVFVVTSALSPTQRKAKRPLSIRITQKTLHTSHPSPSFPPSDLDLGSPTSTVTAGPISLPKLSPRPTSLSNTRIQARRPHALDLTLPSSPRSRRSLGHSARLSPPFSSDSLQCRWLHGMECVRRR